MVSNMFNFHPCLRRWPNLTCIFFFQMAYTWFNHQPQTSRGSDIFCNTWTTVVVLESNDLTYCSRIVLEFVIPELEKTYLTRGKFRFLCELFVYRKMKTTLSNIWYVVYHSPSSLPIFRMTITCIFQNYSEILNVVSWVFLPHPTYGLKRFNNIPDAPWHRNIW